MFGADPLPSTCSAGDFLDIWSHPTPCGKWQAYLTDLAISDMPLQVVALCDRTPVTASMSLVFATFGQAGGPAVPRLLSAAQVVAASAAGPMIPLDLPMHGEREARRRLSCTGLALHGDRLHPQTWLVAGWPAGYRAI